MNYSHTIKVPKPLSLWQNIDDERHVVSVQGLTVGPTPACEVLVVAQWGYKEENLFAVPLEEWPNLWVPA